MHKNGYKAQYATKQSAKQSRKCRTLTEPKCLNDYFQSQTTRQASVYNYKVRSVNQPTERSSCLKYKSEWEEMADELIAAKKIIQLLQEDLNTYKDLTPPHVPDVRSTSKEIHKLP